jgi:hypothetical protein
MDVMYGVVNFFGQYLHIQTLTHSPMGPLDDDDDDDEGA